MPSPAAAGVQKTIAKGQAAPKKKKAAAAPGAPKKAAPASSAAGPAGPLRSVLGAMEKAQLVKLIAELVKSGAVDGKY